VLIMMMVVVVMVGMEEVMAVIATNVYCSLVMCHILE
jgi:hypothetical protein